MAISVKVLPILEDNYIPILRCSKEDVVAVFDPGSAAEVLSDLAEHGGQLTRIFLTHHHDDHIAGVDELVSRTGAKVIGYNGDISRLPQLDAVVMDGDIMQWAGSKIEVMHLAGHTTGHIAYYMPDIASLFCGDVLFSMGCGRLFEGSSQEMFDSLQRIKELSNDTLIYCAHEYTVTNGEFALSQDPNNTALQQRMQLVRLMREKDFPTVPTLLADERATNPFLLAATVDDFSILREARNNW